MCVCTGVSAAFACGIYLCPAGSVVTYGPQSRYSWNNTHTQSDTKAHTWTADMWWRGGRGRERQRIIAEQYRAICLAWIADFHKPNNNYTISYQRAVRSNYIIFADKYAKCQCLIKSDRERKVKSHGNLYFFFILWAGSQQQLKRWQDAPKFPSNSRPSRGGGWGPLSPSEPIWSGGLRTLRWYEKASPEAGSTDWQKKEEQGGGGRTDGMLWAFRDVRSCVTHSRKGVICVSPCACVCLDNHLSDFKDTCPLQDMRHSRIYVCVCVRVNKWRAVMTVCHMILLHGNTNGVSLNERPAAGPPLIPYNPVVSPLSPNLSSVSSNSTPTLFPL